jgi:hypothetical protein
LSASYVRSSAVGDLNDFNSFYGNVAKAIIRPNERSLLAFNAPNRFLFWATRSFKLTIAPVLDISGFPCSIVGAAGLCRHATRQEIPEVRFTRFGDAQTNRLPFTKQKGRIGVRLLTSQQLQPVPPNNLASSRFGTFFNSRAFKYAASLSHYL